MGDWTMVNSLTLSLMTMSYVVGEVAHWLIAVTSKDLATDIGFGTKKCFSNGTISTINKTCTSIGDELRQGITLL